MEKLQLMIKEQLLKVCEDICDNYCKYRETADEDCKCDIIREKGSCPLDVLGQKLKERSRARPAKVYTAPQIR